MSWTREQVASITRRPSLFDQIAQVARPSDFTLLTDPTTHCSHCRKREEPHWLFIHEDSGCRLCQTCLGTYIAGTIDEDGCDVFQGYTFEKSRSPYGGPFQVTDDDQWISYGDIYECVEAVLMRLKLI